MGACTTTVERLKIPLKAVSYQNDYPGCSFSSNHSFSFFMTCHTESTYCDGMTPGQVRTPEVPVIVGSTLGTPEGRKEGREGREGREE